MRTNLRVHPLSPREVRAWYAHVDRLGAAPIDPESPALWRWLRPDERSRYERYRTDRDRSMFLLGRVMARALVGEAAGVDPWSWAWREGPRGRPEIGEPRVSVRFNLAHSAGMVVCAVAEGREVGVDVEDLARRPADLALVRRCCSPLEIAELETAAAGERHDLFLRYWTLKEAYLKARGLGLSVPLSDISLAVRGSHVSIAFSDALAGWSTGWEFRLERLTDRHLMAVAVAALDEPSTFVIAPLPPGILEP
jgi:4'-phosphopantetheinyl transferase